MLVMLSILPCIASSYCVNSGVFIITVLILKYSLTLIRGLVVFFLAVTSVLELKPVIMRYIILLKLYV